MKGDLTELLARITDGDHAAASDALSLVYDELRAIAGGHFKRLGDAAGANTLQATALVNEAYIRLVEAKSIHIHDRKHFCVLIAKIMRQILVDHARAKGAIKRGGDRDQRQRITLAAVPGSDTPSVDLLDLEDALARLSEISPERARLVELRFFGGLTSEEAADVLDISRAEAARRWRAARAWLAVQLQKGD